jgi:hypothetical protein
MDLGEKNKGSKVKDHKKDPAWHKDMESSSDEGYKHADNVKDHSRKLTDAMTHGQYSNWTKTGKVAGKKAGAANEKLEQAKKDQAAHSQSVIDKFKQGHGLK